MNPSMISFSPLNVFGVRVDGLAANDVLKRADGKTGAPFWIVTANPEILLYARSHPAYREAINRADVRIADGFGLCLAGLIRGRRLKRTTGVDLAQAIVDRAAAREDTVVFLGGGPGVAARALEHQTARHPELRGYAAGGGLVSQDGAGDAENEEALHQISVLGPKVLLVAFGHPKQEMWIARHLREFPSVRTIIGIGGTFDYWSGLITRAPAWMRSLGLEWLYRLFSEPRRLKRIWNAVVVFPALFFIDLFSSHREQTSQ